jgi:hypothetical protein
VAGAVDSDCAVKLFWLPLGAGGHSVRLNGRVYEAVLAAFQRRTRRDLYHSALEVISPEGRYVVEMAPVMDADVAARGVVAQGPVGSRVLRPWRFFRYEVRCWRDGTIPDVDEAVDSPQLLSHDAELTERIVQLVRTVPTYVWGRDALGVHDMWNSNSLTSWLLVSSGVDLTAIRLPPNGRAPGWDAGIAAARHLQ